MEMTGNSRKMRTIRAIQPCDKRASLPAWRGLHQRSQIQIPATEMRSQKRLSRVSITREKYYKS